jgi:hypothetical protein
MLYLTRINGINGINGHSDYFFKSAENSAQEVLPGGVVPHELKALVGCLVRTPKLLKSLETTK